jgi:(S)-2-hydroxyglutarate dehydrogenase
VSRNDSPTLSESTKSFDVAVIGAGIVGLASARALLLSNPRLRLVVLEKERRLAVHQTGRNSGVIHSGLYYTPGSMKARNCCAGRDALYRFCEERGILHERCGKLVIATRTEELPALEELERRGRANGLTGLRRLKAEEIRELEPHAAGLAGLHVPQTGIVDFATVAAALAAELNHAGVEILMKAPLRACRREGGEFILETGGDDIRARALIACAGLQADRVARLCGVDPGLRIVPFRGDYLELAEPARPLVRNLIYPVPDPRFPFLGVHLTRMIDGRVEAGPNAILALDREGYRPRAFNPRDAASTLGYPGFWRMAARYGKYGLGELRRSWSRESSGRALQRLIPDLRMHDLQPAGCGIRAQAVLPDGSLADDFRIARAERMIHVLNAPSPAATASLAIGETIAHMAMAIIDP